MNSFCIEFCNLVIGSFCNGPDLLANYKITKSASGFLQLGVLLHQLLQAEAWKLYRNLGFFAFSFTLVDGSLAVFGMTDSLSRTKSALARRLFDRSGFGSAEFFAAAGEELGDVLDRVVGARGCGLL